jgi:mRNA-degrading endonuclease toxin of MazEF toxin-antitoxin module
MRRGEVWRVRLPAAAGHTQAGTRPAIVAQDDRFLPALPTVLVVPCTGQRAATGFPGTLLVQPDGHNGLTVPSVALVFQTTALDRRNGLDRLGVLDTLTLDQILEVLDRLVGR